MQTRQDPIPLIYSPSLFQVFILIMLFLALLYGQRGLVILSLLLLTMFSITRIWCRYSQAGLEYRLAPAPEKVFPGEAIDLQADIINHRFLPVWVEINVVADRLLVGENLNNSEEEASGEASTPDAAGKTTPHNPVSSVPLETGETGPDQDEISPVVYTKTMLNDESGLLWKQVARFNWTLAPVKRGIYRTGPVYLTTGDFFGFYRKESQRDLYKEITVYPRLVTLNPFSPPLQELFGTPGSKSPVVDPVYPVSTRDYQENRPARHIHWKASARHDRLQEKVFEPSVQQKILLVIDVHGFTETTDHLFEAMLEVVATLAVTFENMGRTFGLVSNGAIITGADEAGAAVIPPGMGPQQLYHLLDSLARLKLETHHLPLSTLLHETGLSGGVTALYFSYYQNPVDQAAADLFAQLKIPVISIMAGSPASGSSGFFSLDQLIGDKEAAAG